MSASARFSRARLKVLSESETKGGIGTLSEKLIHKILKFYVEPDDSCHECPVDGCVADVLNADGVTEIQTGNFQYLLPKLKKLLQNHSVRVVLPLTNSRTVHYVDKITGEVVSSRKSPRRDGINHAACELYKIKELIPTENLRVSLIFLDLDEYRYKTEKKSWQKPKDSRISVIPSGIARELELLHKEDYLAFLPSKLRDTFTSAELGKIIRLDSRRTHNTLTLLLHIGLISRERSGKTYIYTKVE